MARRSRKSSKDRKRVADRKSDISKLLDTRKITDATKKIYINNEGDISHPLNSQLEKEYSKILEKFRPAETNGKSDSLPVKRVWSKEKDDKHEIDNMPHFDDSNKEVKSTKRLKKMQKPTLSELKSETCYPQMVEWYDCDAKFPHLLVSIKTSKNTVPVPAHWQMKREYLSGRSLLEKRPFELPDIIKQTEIDQMRKTFPDGEEDASLKSSKEISRARVQPRLGTLDIDYAKLRDIFFKVGSKWRPDLLLPFGDLFYENRNLQEEAHWQKITREKVPGQLSDELREIMHLKEGQLPPWCIKMKKIGTPPSYPTLKIAGLNWGIENLRGNIYGKLENLRKKRRTPKLFGTIVTLEEDEEEEEEKEIENLEHHDIDETNGGRTADTKKEIPPLDPLGAEAPYEGNSGSYNKLSQFHKDGLEADHRSPKQLYKILSEKQAEDSNEYVTTQSLYEIPKDNNSGSEKVREAEILRDNIQDEDNAKNIRNFKF